MSEAQRTAGVASMSALYLHIETAFSEITELCVAARAASLVQERRATEAPSLNRTMAMAPSRSTAVATDFDVQRDPRAARAEELARDLAFREIHADGPDIVDLRARLRKRLAWLKSKLGEVLTEHEVYYTLFPVVVYCDEMVASIAPGQTLRWEPLQGELYDIQNGGEMFYQILEERLRKEETPPIVFEVFFYCLSDGFVGMYEGDPRKVEEYKARLAARIPLRETDEATIDRRDKGKPVELAAMPWKYYAVGVAAVLAWWLVLQIYATLSSI